MPDVSMDMDWHLVRAVFAPPVATAMVVLLGYGIVAVIVWILK